MRVGTEICRCRRWRWPRLRNAEVRGLRQGCTRHLRRPDRLHFRTQGARAMTHASREKLGASLDSVLPRGHMPADIRLNGAGYRGQGAGHEPWHRLQPITSTLPPVEPFAAEMLPAPLHGYVLDVADRQQA